jgi:Uma2 family endonuclease
MTIQEPPAPIRLYTLAEFEALPDDGNKYELDRGELITMPPPKREHGLVVVKIARVVGNFAEEHDLGEVVSEVGYLLSEDPAVVRAPDVAFTSKARLTPPDGQYDKVAPDLVIEVASPSNTADEFQLKIEQYFAAGTRRAWLFYSNVRAVYDYEAPDKVTILRGDAVLRVGDVLPGFEVVISAIFAVLDGPKK